MKYRKKPVVIEAYYYDHELFGIEPKMMETKWLAEAFELGVLYFKRPSITLSYELYVKTLEGEMKVSVGDYIIRGVKGELYPCKPDIFKDTYDPEE